MKDFSGKVAVITGAASGIGLALTKKCLAEGMQVVMADIQQDALDKAAADLQAAGNNNILAVRTDVSLQEEIEALAKKSMDPSAQFTFCLTTPVLAAVVTRGKVPPKTGNGSSALTCGASFTAFVYSHQS